MIEGKCLCGDISYTLRSDLLYLYNCHCVECRAFSGASYATNASIIGKDLHLNDRYGQLTEYRTEKGVRNFCGKCGSSIYSYPIGYEEFPALHAGTLTAPPNKAIDSNNWVSEKCPWVKIPESVKRYEKAPEKELKR